jgi:hypothetical protein
VGEARGRSWLILGIAAVPVVLYFGGVLYGTVADARDDERWEELRTAAVLDYGHRTDAEVDAAGSTWSWTQGSWPLPLPDGMQVLGFSAVGDAELVLVSTDLNSERCLLLAFDDDGMRANNDISCQAYRASPR